MVRINVSESHRITVNVIVLALFYTLFGALISYVMYYIFDEYNEDWKKKSILFQTADVAIEVSIIAVVAFWSSRITEMLPPFLTVRKELDTLVDGYISGIFFIFAVFVFMDHLSEKLRFVFEKLLSNYFTKLFPQFGSIVNLSLSYRPPRKTDEYNYTS
jgi:hypothetical protein